MALADSAQDYQMMELLGRGGFATVYRAKCLRSGREVAVKMIDKARMATAKMVPRVRQEVAIHSRLKHPSILELYTFFEDSQYVYLVLELAHNGELARHFKLNNGGMSEQAAANILRQVVEGVVYLHSHNIIHRDLSLNNLLVTKDMEVKIADFGLATQLAQPDEKHMTMCGTPNYISPEVASRSRHGLPADVWGIGCLLYTLLAGKPPFETKHVKQTLNKVIHDNYEMPLNLSFEAQDLLERLLKKNPADRISLQELVRHPFLLKPYQTKDSRMSHTDSSKDSGFHTTLLSSQSVQHHSAAKSSDRMNYMTNSDIGNHHMYGSFEKQIRRPLTSTPVSLNVLSSSDRNNKIDPFKSKRNYFPNENNTRKYLSEQNLAEIQTSSDVYKNQPFMNDIDMEQVLPRTRSMQNVGSSNPHDDRKVAENKENILSSKTIGVPPLCSLRLPVISHRTRNAELNILDDHSVVIHFIKKRGRLREDRVTEVCKISKDGMQVIVYSVENGRGISITSPLPNHTPTPQETFTYHNLPQKHWKKYLYAARFVNLVKAKTPKITLYGSLAKCYMMENGTDYEANFYNGGKIIITANDGLKITDENGNVFNSLQNTDEHIQEMYHHLQDCIKRCHEIDNALQETSQNCFPLIVGRRPANAPLIVDGDLERKPQQITPTLPTVGSINIGSFCQGSTSGNRNENAVKNRCDNGFINNPIMKQDYYTDCNKPFYDNMNSGGGAMAFNQFDYEAFGRSRFPHS